MSFVADLSALVAASADHRHSCPVDWSRVPLGSVAKIINGFPFKSGAFGAAGHPVIRIRDVARGFTNTRFDGEAPAGYWVEAGDLIVGMDGDFQTAFWRSEPALLNQRVCKVVPDETRIDRRYLAYVLPGYLELINANTPSVTVKHLSSRTLASIPLPLPPLARQEAIARRIEELFAEIDDGEAALARARGDLATWRKALLKAAVTGELTADWRAAHSATETGVDLLARVIVERREQWEADPKNRGKRYKVPLAADADTLPAIPSEWTWAKAEQVVRKAEYGTSMKCHEDPSGPPVLRMGNIQDGGLDWRKLKYAPTGAALPMLEAGDVLFNRTNSAELLGKSAVFDGADGPVSFASYIVAVRLVGVLPHFFSAWMNSIYGRQWIAQNKSQQVGQANLSAGTLMRMDIPVPPIAEQKRIVELIAADRARDDALGNDLDELAPTAATLRQSILAAAFRGELA